MSFRITYQLIRCLYTLVYYRTLKGCYSAVFTIARNFIWGTLLLLLLNYKNALLLETNFHARISNKRKFFISKCCKSWKRSKKAQNASTNPGWLANFEFMVRFLWNDFIFSEKLNELYLWIFLPHVLGLIRKYFDLTQSHQSYLWCLCLMDIWNFSEPLKMLSCIKYLNKLE